MQDDGPGPTPPGDDWPSSQPTPPRPPAEPRIVPRPDPSSPSGAEEGTRIVPRTGTPDSGAAEGTRIVERHPSGQPQRSQSWVSNESWAKHTETPVSVPPIGAADVPTFPQFSAHGFAQNYAAYSLPEDRFEAPPETHRKSFPKLPVSRIIGWAFAVVLLAVAAGAGWVTFIRDPGVDPNVKVPVATTASIKLVRGDEVVRQYLEALAAGDVEKARSLGPLGGEGSSALLTRRAYAESLKQSPITDIRVPTTDENATDIPATYKLGGKEISTRFRVRKLDSGSWEMAQTTVTFRMQGTNVTNVPLIVNGVRLDWATPLELVPGHYSVSTGLPFLSYSSSDALTVLHLGYTDITSHPVTPLLTETGTAAFKDAVRRSLEACVSRKELAPANCPMGFQSSRPVVPGSASWRLNGDPVGNARGGLVAGDQSKAEVTVAMSFSLSLTFTDQGRLNNSPIDARAVATAVMTVEDPSLVKVEWRNV